MKLSLARFVERGAIDLDADQPPAGLDLAARVETAGGAAEVDIVGRLQALKTDQLIAAVMDVGPAGRVAHEAAEVAAAPIIDRRRRWRLPDRHVGRDRRASHAQREERDASK